MLNNDPFYHGTIKKYTALFGALFSKIYIDKNDDKGNLISKEKVPIKYSPKDKILIRNKEDPDYTKKIAINLPVIAFEMGGYTYDQDRHLISINRIAQRRANDPNYFSSQYVPVPYNIAYNLYIYVKNLSDGSKIVEQIVPFFTPEYTVTAQMIPEIELETRDIPIELVGGPTITEIYDGSYDQRMMILWELNFMLKGWFWGPIKKRPIIKFVKINKHIGMENTIISSTTIQPGLTANGQPTSNIHNSVDALTIYVDDDYGFVEINNG